MTTFQAVIYSIVHAFTELLPVSARAHHDLFSYFLGWEHPDGHFLGALIFGTFFALLIWFRHDWGGMISGFLQVILLRRRPMTMDERMPFFVLIAMAPVVTAWLYFRDQVDTLSLNPLVLGAVVLAFGFPLWMLDGMSRKNKTMADWNWIDALITGFAQILCLIPGCGIQTAIITGAMARNFNREAAVKFSLLVATPLLGASSWLHLRGLHFQGPGPMPNVSWLTFGTALVVTTLTSLLVIGGFMKGVEKKGFGKFFAYRFFLFFMVTGFYYWQKFHG